MIVIIALVCNIMLVRYGEMSHYGVDIPITIIRIEIKIFTVVINLVVGIVLGCQLIISYNIEAKNYSKVQSNVVLKPSKWGIIITIGREYGSSGKQIVKLVAEKLDIPFYYKEMTVLAAQERGLGKEFISVINANSPAMLHSLYLSTDCCTASHHRTR